MKKKIEMDRGIIVILLAFLFLIFLIGALYVSSNFKKYNQEIKNLENKSSKFWNRDVVETIVDQMDKVKMLVSSTSDVPYLTTNISEIGKQVKIVKNENEHTRSEINQVDENLKSFIKEYNTNYQKLLGDFKKLESPNNFQPLSSDYESFINTDHTLSGFSSDILAKECPKPPVELKFAADVIEADKLLENSLVNPIKDTRYHQSGKE
jgi:hypothetical protein